MSFVLFSPLALELQRKTSNMHPKREPAHPLHISTMCMAHGSLLETIKGQSVIEGFLNTEQKQS